MADDEEAGAVLRAEKLRSKHIRLLEVHASALDEVARLTAELDAYKGAPPPETVQQLRQDAATALAAAELRAAGAIGDLQAQLDMARRVAERVPVLQLELESVRLAAARPRVVDVGVQCAPPPLPPCAKCESLTDLLNATERRLKEEHLAARDAKAKLQALVDTAQSDVEAAAAERFALQRQVGSLQRAVDGAHANVRTLEASLAGARAEVRSTRQQLAEALAAKPKPSPRRTPRASADAVPLAVLTAAQSDAAERERGMAAELAAAVQAHKQQCSELRQQVAALTEELARLRHKTPPVPKAAPAPPPPSGETPFAIHVSLTTENQALRRQVAAMQAERKRYLSKLQSTGPIRSLPSTSSRSLGRFARQ